ncbi:uncharacterized protein LOC113278882 [Papaver somniferum]|uniref:uncharacterized protein LOC113278882 n=1 Tax=Papaver somniferum TaxID=3469 RepID=UPI000E6F576E|nr:uncharacterized protein LOC113278882 [Papaver somniferum]
MAANTQQFNTRGMSMCRKVNEVTSSSHLKLRIGNMEKMMQQMAAVIIPSYEKKAEQVNAVFPNQQRQTYDPYSNTYNPGWRDHPNFSYANTQATAPWPVFNRPSGFQQQPQPTQNSESSEMLAMMKNLTTMVQKNQQKTDGAIKESQIKMSTMAEYAEKSKDSKGPVLEKEIIDSSQTDEVPKTNSKPLVSTYVPLLPFHRRFDNAKRVEQDKEILDVLKKIHVNIPLIDAIRQKLPPKCKDPGSLDIPVVIGNKMFGKAILDLGAWMNVMPASIYESLNLRPLKETRIVLELADRSNVYPRGIIEDVLVQVNQLVFPVDFYVLKMESGSDASIPLLLGRPFMKTAKTVIDVDKGTLTMEFDDENIRFNNFRAMRYPSDVHSDVHANVLDAS